MITPEQIAEIAPYWEEYNQAEDPASAGAKQAKFIFFSECKKVYLAESADIQQKWEFHPYIAAFITPELLRYLEQRQSKFATIQPERRR